MIALNVEPIKLRGIRRYSSRIAESDFRTEKKVSLIAVRQNCVFELFETGEPNTGQNEDVNEDTAANKQSGSEWPTS